MQTDDIYMSITGQQIAEVSYHKTATEAALACGFNKWDCALPALAISRLVPGDEMSMNSHDSVVRLTGKDIDYVDIRN